MCVLCVYGVHFTVFCPVLFTNAISSTRGIHNFRLIAVILFAGALGSITYTAYTMKSPFTQHVWMMNENLFSVSYCQSVYPRGKHLVNDFS